MFRFTPQNLSHFFECQNCAKVSFYPTKFITFFDAKFPTVSFPPLLPQAHLSLQYLCVKIHMDKSSKIQDKLVDNTNTSYQVQLRKVDSNTKFIPFFFNAKIVLKFRFTPQNLSHFFMSNFLKFRSLPYPHKHICHFSTSV